MTTYAQDRDGKYIPASQRPDGTWRKARRVKDGYVPQEEVPLYESKGKLFMKRPEIPVGMCPMIVQQAKERRDKQQQKQNPIPGLYVLPNANSNQRTEPKKSQPNAKPANGLTSSSNKKSAASVKRTKAPTNSAPATTAKSPATASSADAAKLSESLKNLDISAGGSASGEDDVAKRIKKLRKKLREIELIETKLASGDLKKPDQDQLDKVGRKKQMLDQLKELEALENK